MDTETRSELEPEFVELGDAKELTLGPPWLLNSEENPVMPMRLEP